MQIYNQVKKVSMISTDNCIHCHLCRDNCAFLSKYGIDIGDTDELKDLVYHCFLCGRCTEVCPAGIDGRQTVLDLRRDRVEEGELKDIEKRFKGLLKEKRDYIYRNWKRASSGPVFFPGCNFPSMYPRTNASIVSAFIEHGIGTVYECCGKPVAELGLKQDEDRIIEEIQSRINENSITEIITGCPNCREFFNDRLGVKVTGIFEKLAELGIGNVIEGDYTFYIPCPDRSAKKWIEEIRPFIGGKIDCIESVQCCGLGGSAAKEEPEIADSFINELKEKTANSAHVVTYCASCTGRFKRGGCDDIDHIITKVIGTNESPDVKKSYINRMLTKIK